MSDAAERERLLQVRNGHAVNGTVYLRNFDQGVVETTGAIPFALSPTFSAYFLVLPNVSPPPGLPGIPVVFAFPEDVFSKYRVPIVVVRRDSFDPALERWNQGAQEFVVAAPEATQVRGFNGKLGATKRLTRPAPIPYDISYTITITARHRGATGIKNQVNALTQYINRVYPPRSVVLVKDSLGMTRTYDTISDSFSSADELIDIADRSMGNMLSLRVLGELHIEEDVVQNQITQLPDLSVDPWNT